MGKPEALRAKEMWEQQIKDLLTEIRDALKGVAPPPPPPAGYPTLAELENMVSSALEKHGALKRATDFYVAAIDLATARATPTEITELANALSLTIFRNTGTFVLYLQKKDDTHKITVDALTYPQTLLIDWFDIKQAWITNTAQSGQSAQILKFFKA